MASEYPCDNEDGNQALFTVSNQQNGDTLFVCPLCFSLMGTAMLQEMFPEVWAQTIAPPEPPPKPRRGKAKDAEDVEPDESDRTMATIVIHDQDPAAEPEGDDECPVCGAMVLDSEQEAHYRTEHPDLPPY